MLRELFAVNLDQHGKRFRRATLLDQPTRAFRHEEQQGEEENARKDAHPEHPSPAGRHVPGLVAEAGNIRVNEIDDENARYDRQLVQGDESAPVLGRGDFRVVQRAQRGGDADADASDDAGKDIPGEGSRDGGAERTDDKQDRGRKDRLLPSVPVAQEAGGRRAADTADDQRGHGPADLELIQSEPLLHKPDGAGNDGRIETEQQPADRGDAGDQRYEFEIRICMTRLFRSRCRGLHTVFHLPMIDAHDD